MKVSIGLLAHNEEATIASVIRQILSQDIVQYPGYQVQLAVVANGCKDNTVVVAEETLKPYANLSNLSAQVVNLESPGKSNAWNEYVHKLAWPDSDFLVFVDADIEFGSVNVIRRLVESLEADKIATVSVDQPKKDILKKSKNKILTELSLKASELRKSKYYAELTGQLYCIRYQTAKHIHMPVGLPVEDGFLRAMVVTDNFTHPDDNSKIIAVNDVYHYFETLMSPVKLYKHEKRIILGSTINAMLYDYLWSNVAKSGKDAGVLIKELNQNDPDWLIQLIEAYKSKKGFWLVPKSLMLKHTYNFLRSKQSIIKKIFLMPIALAASMALILISLNVNLFLRKNNGIGHW